MEKVTSQTTSKVTKDWITQLSPLHQHIRGIIILLLFKSNVSYVYLTCFYQANKVRYQYHAEPFLHELLA
jgi:hypothetical protein